MNLKQNFFELLSVPQQYTVDKNILSVNYRELQKEFHPDKYAAKAENEQRLAVQLTAYINTGFQTLTSPVMRAEYLLQLAGVDIDQQSTTINDGQFLMLQMEWRESLSDIADEADIDTAENQLDALRDTVGKEYQILQQQFKQQYEDALYSDAKQVVAKLYFVFKMSQEIEALDAKLFD